MLTLNTFWLNTPNGNRISTVCIVLFSLLTQFRSSLFSSHCLVAVVVVVVVRSFRSTLNIIWKHTRAGFIYKSNANKCAQIPCAPIYCGQMICHSSVHILCDLYTDIYALEVCSTRAYCILYVNTHTLRRRRARTLLCGSGSATKTAHNSFDGNFVKQIDQNDFSLSIFRAIVSSSVLCFFFRRCSRLLVLSVVSDSVSVRFFL